MRLNDNNTFIGINPPYQLSVIHSSKLIYPREIYQRGVERKRVELIARDFNEYIVMSVSRRRPVYSSFWIGTRS